MDDREHPSQSSGLPPPALHSIAGAALFLDFDGTLVEIADRPNDIDVSADLPDLICAVGAALCGRLAIVSGRSLDALDAYLGDLGVVIVGSHGAESRLPDGRRIEATPRISSDAISAAEAFAKAMPGVQVEIKSHGVALHYRGAPPAAGKALAFVADLAQRHSLKVKHGKMVAELVTPGADKGAAVRMLMAMAPFRDAYPLFVGDDVTDEDGFAAAQLLGGSGVLVGAPRETDARFRLPDVAAVHSWLRVAVR